MLIKIINLAVLVCIFSCNNQNKIAGSEKNKTSMETGSAMLSAQEVHDGWELLFDGKTTQGWHKFGNKPIGSAWKVADGNLYLDASEKENWQIKGGGDIVTEKEFENFHLKLEWKVDSGANSGIMFLVHEDPKYKYPWETGPEMQVLDNERHADAKINKHRAGDLYDLIACSVETVKPALQWNAAEIKCQNGNLEFWLNGTKVVSTILWDDNWKKMIRNSKWASHKDFATYKKGKIALQDHGDRVWFRNIKIKRL